MIASAGMTIASGICSSVISTLANEPGMRFPAGIGDLRPGLDRAGIRIDFRFDGVDLAAVLVLRLAHPDQDLGPVFEISRAYFSGTENSIFIGSMSCMVATSVFEVT